MNRLEDQLAEGEQLWEEGAHPAVQHNARSAIGRPLWIAIPELYSRPAT